MNKYREIIVLCLVGTIITLCIVIGPKKTLHTIIGVKETVTEAEKLVDSIDKIIEDTEEELKMLEKYKDGNN